MIINKLVVLAQEDESVTLNHFVDNEYNNADLGLALSVRDGDRVAQFNFNSPAEVAAFAQRLILAAQHHEDMHS